MRAVLFAVGLLGLLSSAALSAEAPARVAGVTLKVEDPGPDLPPVGSSVFDKLFYSEISTSYSVPFPIKKLLERVFDRGRVTYTLIPFTRSLQRPVDLSYDPLKKPRMVFALGSANPQLDAKLFWAYSEPRDQLEVISYNEEAGRYEFQLVTDYSRSPKVTYASRAKCMTCHQGQGPIFEVANWDDTTDSSSRTRSILMKANGDFEPVHMGVAPGEKFLAKLFLGSEDFVDPFDGKVRDSAASYEFFSADALRFTIFQRAWVFGCGDDNACRLNLLKRAAGCYEDTCPDASRVIERSVLSRENAASSSITGGFDFLSIFQTLFPGPGVSFSHEEEAATIIAGSDQFRQQVIDRLSALPKEHNPATSRIKPLTETYERIYAGRFAEEALRIFERPLAENPTLRAIEELYREGSPIFSKKPLNSGELARAVSRKTGLRLSYDLLKPVRVAAPEVSEKPIPTFFSSAPLNALTRACGSCHQTSATYPPQFLAGNEDRVRARVEAIKPLIRARIERDEMPPKAELQSAFHQSPERDVILEYVRAR